jgi:predicted nucleic acid-binding protein
MRQDVFLEPKDIVRATELGASGLSSIDELHVACAERIQIDVFLTTDDQLLRCAKQPASRVRVENPYNG